jgi:hypothetical protein
MRWIATLLAGLVIGLTASESDAQARPGSPTTFTVRVDNISRGNMLQTSAAAAPILIAPGVWVRHTHEAPGSTSPELSRCRT